MRSCLKIFASVVFAATLTLPFQASFAKTMAKDSATFDFEARQVRLIFGGAGGSGVLHYEGRNYPFKMKAVSVGGVGVSDLKGSGTVHNLKSIDDLAGTYVGVGAGAAMGSSGKGGSTYRNEKGVTFTTKSRASGMALNLGASGVVVTLD